MRSRTLQHLLVGRKNRTDRPALHDQPLGKVAARDENPILVLGSRERRGIGTAGPGIVHARCVQLDGSALDLHGRSIETRTRDLSVRAEYRLAIDEAYA